MTEFIALCAVFIAFTAFFQRRAYIQRRRVMRRWQGQLRHLR